MKPGKLFKRCARSPVVAATATLALVLGPIGPVQAASVVQSTASAAKIVQAVNSRNPAVLLAASSRQGAAEHLETGPQIVTDTVAVMTRADNFHVTGHSSIPALGISISVNLSDSPTGGGGTITENGGTMQVVVQKSSVYVKADQHSWDVFSHGNTLVGQELGGKWVRIPASEPGITSFALLTVSSRFIHTVLPGAYVALATRIGMGHWDGRQAVVVGVATSQLYVADNGSPYLLHIQSTALGTAYYNFTDFGDAPMPSVPKTFISA